MVNKGIIITNPQRDPNDCGYFGCHFSIGPKRSMPLPCEWFVQATEEDAIVVLNSKLHLTSLFPVKVQIIFAIIEIIRQKYLRTDVLLNRFMVDGIISENH